MFSGGRHDASAIVVGGTQASARAAVRLRRIAWSGLPALAVLYYVILVSGIPPLRRLALLEVIYCTPIVLTVAWGIVAAMRSEGSERRFWSCLAVANAMLFCCEVLLVYWVVELHPAGPPRISWPFHILHGIAAVSLIGSLVALSRFSRAPGVTRVRWSLDTALVTVAGAVLLLQVYIRPIMGMSAPLDHALLGLAYAVFAFVMAGGTLLNVVGFKIDAWRPWDRMFAVALSVYAVGTFLWPAWYQTVADTSRNYERGVLDLVQFGGHWLLMAAAVYRLTEVPVWEIRPLPPVNTSRWPLAMAIAPAATIVGMGAAVFGAAATGAEQAWQSVFQIALGSLAVLALARSIVTSVENAMLARVSGVDPLTGLLNHRAFMDRLNEECERSARYGLPLSVVLLDVDEFAEANERLGHEGGDRLLKEIGEALVERYSKDCAVARLAGDDFAIVAPGMDALTASARARRALDLISIELGDGPGLVTACAGVASACEGGCEARSLFAQARSALRRAKQSGRDQLAVTD